MKLTHIDLEENFCVQPDTVNVLVVEPEDKFYCYCREILAQTEGDDGGFCLSEKDKILNLSKTAVAVNLFDLKTNEKKLITKLYSCLHSLLNEQFYFEAAELAKNWETLFNKLNAESNCAIEYEEDDFSLAILKAFNVKFSEKENVTLLEKIISFIHVSAEFASVKMFIFVNLKTMLTEEELVMLYNDAALRQVNLFLLENTLKPVIKSEKIILIDRDLCEILVSE